MNSRTVARAFRLLSALALCLGSQAALAQAATALWVQRDTATPSLFQYPSSTPQVSATQSLVSASAGGYSISIAVPNGTTLVPGAYENATRYPFNGNGPGLDVTSGSLGCNTSTGRFVVLESAFDGNQLIRLAIDFEHHCEGGSSATWGELRVNSTVPITANRAPGWVTPDPFAFRPRTFVSLGAEVLSNFATVYGINAPAPISIDAGQYSINGGPFTSAPGTVNNRDTVRVLLAAPAAPSTSATANLGVGGRTVPFVVSTYTEGQPVTGIYLQGTAGDYIFGGRTLLAMAPDWSITASGTRNTFQWSMTGGSEWWYLDLNGGSQGPFAVGGYENASRAAFSGNAPGVDFSGDGRGCNTTSGRISVLEATYADNGTLLSFAADFEQHCEGGPYPLFGEVRWNSSVPFSFERAAGWTQPDPFTFRSRSEVSAGSVVTSNAVTIYGINAPAPIQVTGGEYRIDGGAWTSSPGTVANRSRVDVRTTASTTPGTLVNARLDVGGTVGNFSVRTYAAGDVISALYFKSTPSDYIGAGQEVTGLPPLWTVGANNSTPGYLAFNINGANGEWYSLDLAAPPGGTLAVGAYENAARAAFRGTAPGLDFNGQGRGCNTIAGRFVVLDIAWSGGTLSRFAANFEQHCEGGSAPLYGEIRFNSSVPLSALKPAGTTTPDPFAFAAIAEVMPATLVESGSATIYGINAASPISITGGEYSVDGGAWTSAPGTVDNLARVRVRTSSPATPGGSANAVLTVGGTSATFTVTTYAIGDSMSAFYFQSGAGDWVGKGATRLGMAPQWTITPSGSSGTVMLDINGPAEYFTLSIAAPPQGVLDVGAYEEAARTSFRGTSPGVEFYGNGAGCNTISGRFSVLDIAWSGSTLARLAVDFQQSCDGGPWLYGEVRYQSAVPLSPYLAAGSTTPDPFAFTPQTNVAAGAMAISNATTIYGINAPAPVSIANGEYSVNGGAFTSAPGSVANRDLVRVRLQAASAAATTREATLTVGGRSATFSVTPFVPGQAITALAYHGTAGDYISGGTSATFFAPANAITATRNYDNGVSFHVTTVGGGWWDLDLAAAGNAALVAGGYPGARRFPFQGPGQPGLEMSGNGAGCNQVAGRFYVYEAVYGSDGSVQRFAADFEQRCELFGPPLYGEIRFNSAVPLASPLARLHRKPHDLDGDGRADLFWRGPGSAYAGWLMSGADAKAYGQIVAAGTGLDATVLGDFDGDGRIDFAGRYPDGSAALWLMNGTAVRGTATLLPAGTGWRPANAGDFDGDGKSDLLWRSDAGGYAVWLMHGTAAAGYGTLFDGAGGYQVTHVADFDGDGKADLLGTAPDGSVHVWTMNGTAIATDTVLVPAGTGWTPALVGDFSGDGRADVLLRHADGSYRIRILNGGVPVAGADVAGPGNGWNAILAADLDGDGYADLVFQHTDGRVAAWLMYGTQLTPAVIAGAGSGWSVVGADDFDGDGKADLLWRHVDGSYAIWMMDGLTPRSYRGILGGGTGWSVVQ